MQLVTGEPCILRVTFADETWDFDESDLTVEQMISIEDATEQSVGQWLDAVMEKRARAVRVLIWWLQGRKVRPEQVEFKIGDLGLELVVKEKPKAPKAGRGKRVTEPFLSS